MSKFLHDAKPTLVEWIDSCHTTGWSPSYTEGDLRCITIGHLVKKTKFTIVLSLSKSQDCCGHYIEIPLIAVKKIGKLKL